MQLQAGELKETYCGACCRFIPTENFHADYYQRSGRRNKCRECTSEEKRLRRLKKKSEQI